MPRLIHSGLATFLLFYADSTGVERIFALDPVQTSFRNQEGTVLIATGELAPYTTSSGDGGCVLHQVKEAYMAMGYKVNFDFMAWQQAAHNVMAGKYVATAFYNDTPERRRQFLFSNRHIVREKYHFYYLENNPLEWKSFKDVVEHKVIYVLGHTYNQNFYRALKEYDIQTNIVNSDEEGLQALLNKHGDIYIAAEKVLAKMSDKLPRKQKRKLKMNDKLVVDQKGHLVFSRIHPKSEDMKDIFDRGYEKVRTDPKLKPSIATCFF